jgi:hypothetical protein
MTYIDLECKSMSTIHILKLCLVIGNLHAKLEDPSATITWDIKHNVNLGQWPLATMKVGQSQRYTHQNFGLGLGTFMQNWKILASLLPKLSCIAWN